MADAHDTIDERGGVIIHTIIQLVLELEKKFLVLVGTTQLRRNNLLRDTMKDEGERR